MTTGPRRVLFVGINYAPEPSGIAPYTTGMAEALAETGCDVRAVTSYPHYPWWKIPEQYRSLPRRETIAGVAVRRVRPIIPRRHTLVTRALLEVTFGLKAAFVRWGRPDVVVLVSPALLSSALLRVKARLLGVPVITWVQDIYTLGVKEAGSGSGQRAVAAIEKGLLQRSDRVIVIHDRFRRLFAEDLHVTTPISVVRNWSHVPDLRGSRDDAFRRSLGWADDDVIVLHAGNMGAKQGLESVVAASRLAADRGSRVRFVLMGDGNARPDLEALGHNAALQYIDPLPDGDFHRALASADILLVNERPGLTEMSVPSKLTTYFATGLPVLAAVDATSTTHDEITAAGCGPCVPAGDPTALLDAAEALAARPDEAARRGRSGSAYRLRVLTEDAARSAFLSIVGEVVSGSAAIDADGGEVDGSAGRIVDDESEPLTAMSAVGDVDQR